MFLPPPGPSDDERISEKPAPHPRPAATARTAQEADAEAMPDNVPQGDDLYLHVAHCMDNGSSEKEIRTQLIAFGYSAQDSEEVVADVVAWRRQNPHAQIPAPSAGPTGNGSTNMLIGGIVCLLGIVVTLGSCMMASGGGGGGSYVIAWGAIIWGAIQFFRGAAQSGQAAPSTHVESPERRSDSRKTRL